MANQSGLNRRRNARMGKKENKKPENFFEKLMTGKQPSSKPQSENDRIADEGVWEWLKSDHEEKAPHLLSKWPETEHELLEASPKRQSPFRVPLADVETVGYNGIKMPGITNLAHVLSSPDNIIGKLTIDSTPNLKPLASENSGIIGVSGGCVTGGGGGGGGSSSWGDDSGNKPDDNNAIDGSYAANYQGDIEIENLTFDYNWAGKYITDEFKSKVLEVSDNLEINPDDLMAVMAFESAGINPTAQNKQSGATGIIQFMPSTAKSLGTSTEELVGMSAIEQLDYVYKYFKPYKGKIHSIEDAYMAVFMPVAVGKPNDFILGKKDSKEFLVKGLSYGSVYAQNSGLDINKDGIITKEEAAQRITDKRNSYGKK
ncbi:transglycosylase SLT domain-containing protein [Oscillospiraceae bacterium WX1]